MKGLKNKQLRIWANPSLRRYTFHQKQSVYLSEALDNDSMGTKSTSFICNASVIGHSLMDMRVGFFQKLYIKFFTLKNNNNIAAKNTAFTVISRLALECVTPLSVWRADLLITDLAYNLDLGWETDRINNQQQVQTDSNLPCCASLKAPTAPAQLPEDITQSQGGKKMCTPV